MKKIKDTVTFDDVLLVPNHSSVLPKDVSLETKLTKKFNNNDDLQKETIFLLSSLFLKSYLQVSYL